MRALDLQISVNGWVVLTVGEGEEAFTATVRYRTVGDATITGAVESAAATVEAVIDEVAASMRPDWTAAKRPARATLLMS